VFAGMADQDLPELSSRAVVVLEDPGERVIEHRRRFLEGDAMLPSVGSRLQIIPLKLHPSDYRRNPTMVPKVASKRVLVVPACVRGSAYPALIDRDLCNPGFHNDVF
jgi:hypothetical protein